MLSSAAILLFAACFVDGCIYRNHECADYIVKEQHPDYEVRAYPALTWISTTEEMKVVRVSMYNAFNRLFKYITGNNDRNMTLNMTVPVRILMTNESQLTMNFMAPSEHAQNLPIPTDGRVTIVHEPARTFAVRTFPGYVWRQRRYTEEAGKLSKSLEHDERFDKSHFYRAGYNSPMQLLNRRNEIWIEKKTMDESNQI